jgi:hypothetical protein
MRGMGDKTEAAEEGFAPSEHPGPLRPGTVVSSMRRIIASLAAGVALAAADMVEHTVTLQVVAGSHEVTRSLRSELWLARDRGRQLVTDATTGSVIAETVATSGEIRTFEPERNTITIESQRTLPFASAAYEAAAQRAGLESERTHKVGERTVRGRHALVLRSREGTVTVVDAETYELYERRTMLPGTVQTETRTTDLLPAGSPRARLTMGPHPGAKVVRTK